MGFAFLVLFTSLALCTHAHAQAIGPDFRITHVGPDGSPAWDAEEVSVAYNPAADLYLVAYQVDTLGASDVSFEGDATEIQVQLLDGAGAAVGLASTISQTGPAGDARFDAALPDAAYNAAANQFLVVWQSDAEADNAFEIYGQLLDGTTGAPIGPNTKLTATGPNGDASFDAIHGHVAWSSAVNRYLLAFQAGGTVAGKRDHEIYAQRLGPNLGAVGTPIAISGPDGDPDRDGLHPDVAYSPAGDLFAVVWEGEVVENDSHIFLELRQANSGDRVGADNQQVSEQGPPGVSHFDADDPAVAYSSSSGRFLVAWSGDASIGAGSGTGDDDEEEIFVRLMSGTNGVPASPPVRVSTTGPDGNPAFDALAPAVAWNAIRHVFVAVWAGEDQADGEVEIYGQEIDDSSGAPTGPDDFRISEMGQDGEVALGAAAPAVAYSSARQEFLAAWTGDDVVDDELEIHGQLLGPGPTQPCQATPTRLCLGGGLFSVEVTWKTRSGATGVGQAVALTGDTGYFWFFQNTNVELVLKALDGRAVNGYFWIFYGALSDVEYTITVTDTFTGKGKVYFNPQRTLASVADTSAFADSGEPAAHTAATPQERSVVGAGGEPAAPATPVPRAACQPSATTLCLNQSAFEITVAWKTRQGATGTGKAVPLTGDTGWFWFFNDANVELMIKVLDGRAVNGYYWVFYGALSDVEYTITVRNTTTNAVRTYVNPQRTLASVADTSAFSG